MMALSRVQMIQIVRLIQDQGLVQTGSVGVMGCSQVCGGRLWKLGEKRELTVEEERGTGGGASAVLYAGICSQKG